MTKFIFVIFFSGSRSDQSGSHEENITWDQGIEQEYSCHRGLTTVFGPCFYHSSWSLHNWKLTGHIFLLSQWNSQIVSVFRAHIQLFMVLLFWYGIECKLLYKSHFARLGVTWFPQSQYPLFKLGYSWCKASSLIPVSQDW